MNRSALPLMCLALAAILAFTLIPTAAFAAVEQKPSLSQVSTLQVPFVENRGQTDLQVDYYARTLGGTLFVTRTGELVYAFPAKDKTALHTIREHLSGAGAMNPVGAEKSGSKINVFRGGDTNKWQTGLSAYNRVDLGEVYNHIHLSLKAYGSNVEKIFTVRPGGNPVDIRVEITRAGKPAVNDRGELEIGSGGDVIRFSAPVAFQEINGKRVDIDVAYRVDGTSYGFTTGEYDPEHPLVIDPFISYATFLGGGNEDAGYAIDVDSSGNAYVCGWSLSTDFPVTTGAAQDTYGGGSSDAFVAMINASGADFDYITYLGGADDDRAYDIAVDDAGNAHVAGRTLSDDFPTTSGAYSQSNAGESDIFITRLNPAGAVTYSTYFGGSYTDTGWAVDVDASGNIYVAGTYDNPTGFPTTLNAYRTTHLGSNSDAFLAKFDPAGSGSTDLLYSTFFGGTGVNSTDIYAIAVDAGGYAYITGRNWYYDTDDTFPTTPGAIQDTHAGQYDAFVSKIDPAGNQTADLIYSTLLGGSGIDQGSGIDVDTAGNAYVTGYTSTADFPVQNAYQAHGGGQDAFVAKINADATALVYSTFLGGSSTEQGFGIAVDNAGRAHVTGRTASSNYPTRSAIAGSLTDYEDAYITQLSTAGNSLIFSSYLGASGTVGHDLTLDASGNVYLTGQTNGNVFPLENPVQDTYGGGSYDAFVAKIDMGNLHDWELMHPYPTAQKLYAVWGSASDDIFAVGNYGEVIHFDGSDWSIMDSPRLEGPLNGVWGSSGTDVFAVGDDGIILHYDGSSWDFMLSGTILDLEAVWGSAADNVFAVGVDGTILHFDGSVWSAMTSGSTETLYGIWGTASNDIFVVGNGGTILHWDGASWTPMTSPFSGVIRAVWGTTGTNVYAAGSSGTVLHYDGAVWQEITGTGISYGLLSVWGTAANNIYFAGLQGSLLHYDGVEFTTIDHGLYDELNAVWGSSADDIYVVGNEDILSAYGAQILHYDGSDWGSQIVVSREDLNGVWGTSPGDLFAVGWNGAVLHYDGTAWTAMTSNTTQHLWGVWGSDGDNVYAVGSDGVMHYDGSNWSVVQTGMFLQAVWGTASDDIFAVGSNGVIIHYDGSTWSNMTSGATATLYGVWGADSSDVFAVGHDGTILHYDGSTWSPMTSGTTAYISDVWGTSGDDVFAAGYYTILHYDGTSWTEVSGSDAFGVLYAVWGSSSHDVFVSGSNGKVVQYDGDRWFEADNLPYSIAGMWGLPDGDIYAVGDNGVVLHTTIPQDPAPPEPEQWRFQYPYPTPNAMTAMWGSASDDIFAVGDGGRIIHYDGTDWMPMDRVNSAHLNGVWGVSGSDVFAVGDGGVILHFNGAEWTARVSGTTQNLEAVWGVSGSDVFAVGSGGVILHYDGSNWSEMTSGTIVTLTGVWGSAGNDVFAVGGGGTILHYNGSSWSEMTSGTANGLMAVWGISGSAVFAAGNGGTILFYDGIGWSAMTSGTAAQLNRVWGTGADNVYAVGSGGALLHYDGANWSSLTSGTTERLSALWGSSASDIYAFGDDILISGQAFLHYDGSTWTNLYDSIVIQVLYDIWGSAPDDIFAVGEYDTLLHYDGSDWTTMSTGANPILYSVWGSSGSDVFAVGHSGDIVHYDGSSWSFMTSNTGEFLYGVWGSAGNDVFSVGGNGTIMHYDGGTWTAMTSTTGEYLRGVWGSAGNDVYAVGDNGTIVHYDGTDWSLETSETIQQLADVWGSASDDVYAVGSLGTILHYDGSAWSSMASGTGEYLTAVWGTAANDVYAVSSWGTVLHYNGSTWSIAGNFSDNLEGVWGSGPSDIYTVGTSGTILQFSGFASAQDVPYHGDKGKAYAHFGVLQGDTYLDFNGLALNTQLTTQLSGNGVEIYSTAFLNGAPISPPNYVLVHEPSPGQGHAIMGSPSDGAGIDGRVTYEIRFSEPHKRAAVERQWSIDTTITRFYNQSDDLIYQYEDHGKSGAFVRYYFGYEVASSDPADWIARIELTGKPSGNEGVGNTYSVSFGSSNLPDAISPGFYYVNPDTGSDANDGTSLADAWQTLHHALNRINFGEPGAYLLSLASGVYETGDGEDDFDLGVFQNNVTIQGDAGGGTIIDGTGADDWIHGLMLYSDTSIVQNVVIQDFSNTGIYVHSSSPFISASTIRNTGGNGIFVYGLYDEASPIIRNNLIYDASGGMSYGIGVGVFDATAFPQIYHNTIDQMEACGIYAYSRSATTADPAWVAPDIRYNLITNSGEYGIYNGLHPNTTDQTDPFLDRNDIWNSGSSNYYQVLDSLTDLHVDPLYVDPNGGDFHLMSSSPVIDAILPGDNDPVTTDIEGNDRPVGTGFDMGAYESLSSSQLTFAQHIVGTTAEVAFSIQAADIDGDGDMDLVAASDNDSTIAWYENLDGAGTFGPENILSTAVLGARAVCAADLDNDGDMDVVAAAWNDGVISWFENTNGDGAFSLPQTIAVRTNPVSVIAADIDHDGDMDVLSASYGDDTVAWYENTGNGSGWTVHIITTLTGGAWDVRTADIDGDGDLDVISAANWNNDVAWYENLDGQGSFSALRLITESANGARVVRAGDMDGDGDLDVVSASWFDGKIAWYENTGSQGQFAFDTQQQELIATADPNTQAMHVADLDHDGDMDVVYATWPDGASGDEIIWMENLDGTGTDWSSHSVTTNVDGCQSLFSVDIDGDLDLDLISASQDDNTIAWYESTGLMFDIQLDATDITPAVIAYNPPSAPAITVLLRIDATHTGDAGSDDIELDTIKFLFTGETDDPLDNGAINALITSLLIFADDGDGVFDGGDVEVTRAEPLDLTAGVQTIDFTDGDPAVQVAQGTQRSYFAAIYTAPDAILQAPDRFRLTHLGTSATASDTGTGQAASVLTNGDVATGLVDPDSDEDLMADDWENYWFGTLSRDGMQDYDWDQLADLEEFELGTEPDNPDTDFDSFEDGYEMYNGYDPLDPLDPDSDADLMADDWEILYFGNTTVSDGSGDVDMDQLSDQEEFERGTEPDNPDTDLDSFEDGWEVDRGYNPMDSSDPDSDGDGMPDDWEILYFGSIAARDGSGDYDSDQLTDLAEFDEGTQPDNADSDGDGFEDGFEVANAYDALDSLVPDSDGDHMIDGWEITYFGDISVSDGTADNDLDTLTDLQEFQLGTLPDNWDSDADPYHDGEEVYWGSDPTDQISTPVFPPGSYYADANASDLGLGTAAHPWPTIHRTVANVNTGTPGNYIVTLMDGEYSLAGGEPDTALIITQNNVTVRGVGNAVIDGTGISGWTTAFEINANNTTVRDLTIQNFWDDGNPGIYISGGSNTRIEDCDINGNYYSVQAEDVSGTTIAGCVFYNSSTAMRFDGGSPTIEGNTVYDSTYAIELSASAAANTAPVIQNNLLYLSPTVAFSRGIAVYGGVTYAPLATIYHNTIEGFETGIALYEDMAGLGGDIRFNIIGSDPATGTGIDFSPYVSANIDTLDYNNVWNSATPYGASVVPSPSDISVDPQYVDAAAGDYRPTQTSPVVDAIPADNPNALGSDIDGSFRPFANGFDMGAFEFITISPEERAALIDLYLNTGGSEWYDLYGWREGPLYDDGFALPGTECSWYGITCDAGYNLIGIDLRNNNLEGGLSASIGDLVNLEFLILGDNQLWGVLPDEIGSLSNLQQLYVDHNNLLGPLPDTLLDLTNLADDDNDLRHNHFYLDPDDDQNAMADFLNVKQGSVEGWELTQTNPLDVSVMNVHEADGSLMIYLAVDLTEGFGDNLPNDVDSITILGPDNSEIASYPGSDFDYYTRWREFFIKLPGQAQIGEYKATVVAGQSTYAQSDYQGVLRTIPVPDTAMLSPADGTIVTSKTPSFQWPAVQYEDLPLAYRLTIHDTNGDRVYATQRTFGMTHFTVPEGVLTPGQTYGWRVRVTDDDDWIRTHNRANSETQYFTVAGSPDHGAVPAIDLDGWGAVSFTRTTSLGIDFWIKVVDHDGVSSDTDAPSHTVQVTFDGETHDMPFYSSASPTAGNYELWLSPENAPAIGTPYTVTYQVTDPDGNTATREETFVYDPVPIVDDSSLSPSIHGVEAITASFDNIRVNGGIDLENFDTYATIDDLDQDTWEGPNCGLGATGSLEADGSGGNRFLAAIGNTVGRGSCGLDFKDAALIHAISANVIVQSATSDECEARIGGYFFNNGLNDIHAKVAVQQTSVVYTVTEMLPGNTITWKDLSSDELMAVTPGQQVTIGIAWDEATQTFTFSADDNSDTYEHTGAVRPPLTDWKTVTARANLTADDTTQTFTWTAVPEAVRYRLRIYNAHGSQIWQGYPSTNAYTVPPGVLEPNAMYKYRVEAWNSHSPINLDNLSKIPASSNDNYVFYTPDTEAVDPMVELDNGGVELWSSSYLGDNTSFWIKVHDAQGVPDNIQNVTVTLPDGTRQTLYHDDGNRYNTSTSGIYRGGYYGTPQSGVYTFSVADRDGNTDDLTENFTANAIDYPAEVSLTPAQGTLLNDTGADFDWEDVAGTAFYRLELIDKNYNRVYAFGTETSDYTLDPGFLKTDAHYRWRVTTWREFFDENIDNASTSPWGRYDNGLNFHTTAAAGTSRPVLDLEDIGVTTQHVVFAGTDRTFYRLYFHAKVTDADGVPENIRQVVVTYPDGVTTLSLKLDEVKADNQATYWGQAAFTDPADIPEGRYTFTVTDHDDRTGQLTDDLVVNVLPIPDGLTPGRDGSVSGTAATLGWNTVEGAVEYRARLYDGWDGTLHWSAFITGNSYDIPADLLEIEKTYGFRIYAYREPGSSGDVDNMSLNSFMYGAIHRFTTGAASPDLDGDGTPDASDNCPANPNKVDPGVCGCDAGEDIGDSDGDGTPNCLDACPDDAAKTEPGQCGCGIADTDRDGDTLADCVDLYPDNPLNIPDPVSPGDDAVITETDAIVLEAEGFNPVGDVTHVHTHWLVKRADDPEAVYDVLSAVDLESHALTAALDPGLKYAWQAGYEDSEGNISWSEESYFSVGTPEQNEAVQVSSGIDIASYRMVSFVQWPTDPSSEAVLGDDMAEDYEGNYRIGRYDPMTGGYIEHGHGLTIEPGRSYWLLARTGLATEVDGVPVSLNHDIYVALDYNTDTGDGWNMVGSPNEAVYEWGSVEVVVYDDDGNVAFGPMAVKYLSEDNPYVDTRLWRWNAGAYAAERPGDATEPVMHVYQGYWVKAKHANVHLKFGVDAQEALLTQKQSLWDKMVAGVRSWMENTGLISSEAIAGDGDTPPMPMGSVDDPDNMLPVAGCFVETTKR